MSSSNNSSDSSDSGSDTARNVPSYEWNMECEKLPLVVIPVTSPTMEKILLREIEPLKSIARIRMYCGWSDEPKFDILQRCKGATVILNMGYHYKDSQLCVLAKSVKCIVFSGTGVASFINVRLAHDLGITVCNVTHYGDASVAEHVFALIFEILRHTGSLNHHMHAHHDWPVWEGTQLAGKTFGIIGLGGIGKAVASIARAFGMNVIAWSRSDKPDLCKNLGITQVHSREEVFANSDVVSLHLTFTPETQQLITSKELSTMKQDAILINTARSQIVEQGAILQLAQEGRVTIGLDVFDEEPLSSDDPLYDLENVIMTPHTAWRTDSAEKALIQQCIHSVVGYLTGKPVNVVDP